MDRRRVLVIAALCLLCGSAWAQDGPVRQKVAVKAGRVITVSGEEIANGVILIQDGRIAQVGAGLEVPWDATVIDASDKVVMPGYVEAHTSEGMSTPNEQVDVVPFINAADGVDPLSWYMEDTLRAGVTTMLMIEGNSTVIGGTGVVIKPFGHTVQDMTLRPYTGMKISLQPMPNSSRMGQIERLRSYFADLREYLEQYKLRKADAEAAKKPFDEKIDPMKQAAIDLIEGKLKAFVYCPLASDAVKALALGKELGFEMVPVLGSDCYKAAGALAAAGLPVVLDPDTIVWKTNEDTETSEMKVVPKIMEDAGVKFAFSRGGREYETQSLWLQAARAVANGVDRNLALRSVTLTPAEIIGVADRVGSIDVGKDANLLILTGDPLNAQTWVDQVLIEGQVVYERSKDQRLKELLEKPKPKEPVTEGAQPEQPAPKPQEGAGGAGDGGAK
jgi:imidazolonepropionase-like amidohydrolase